MKVHRFWILTLICFTIIPSSIADDPKIVCYYTNWSIYRPGNAKYSPQNINPYLCTHLIYAFGGFTKDNTLQPFDKYQDIEKGGYAKFTGLKTYNKNLKTLLAIGGWNEGSARFSPLVANSERRREFVKNTVKYLRQNHFDGLDLDWEYPTFRDGGKSKDRANYAQLVQELSEEFDRESSKTGRTRLLLTLAIPAGVDKIDKGYDVIKLNQYLDWFNVLTYDYHDSFEPATNHHAPLYPLEEDNEYNYDSELNIDYSVKHLINAGADRQKLVLGIPTYGRSYTLFNADATDIGAPTDGPGEPGDATREKGFLAYYEICQNIKSDEEWTVMHPNDKAMGPYSYHNDQWISYDDEKMARRKAMYVAENNLGGIMFWSIDTDDFRGTCTGKPYPLIEAAKEGLLDALGVKKSNEPTRKTTTRNKNRPNTEQKNQASTSFKENFNRRRRPSTKPTVKPTQPSVVYNLKTTTPEPPTTPDPGSDFKCEEDGFFPHPRDCKKYFWCLDSGPSNLGIVAHQFTCPSGLVFNKQADSCDYTRNVACSKTDPPTTKARPPPTTTYKPTTKLFTTQRTTTNKPTTTPTTPSYEDDDYEALEYENENAEPERDIEDPKVIKELIDLIRKAGGLEELEKQLKFTEEISPENDNTDKLPTTQSTFSKSLYDKFLKRKQLENRFVNTEGTNKVKPDSEVHNEKVNIPKVDSMRYSSVIRNSRPNSQIAGLENLPEFEGFLKEKPQYVTIQRFRTTTNSNVKIVDSEETNNDEDDDDDTRIETSTRSAFQPQYVNIQRNRFTTQSTVIEEVEPDEFGQSPLATISVTISPQYTTINRRRRPNVTDIVEESPIPETDSTTQVVEVTSLVNARTQTRYKPISRTTSKIDSEPDTTKKYVNSGDEEFDVTTETVALNTDTKYQNINRRNTIKISLETTTVAAVPTIVDEIIVPQTTVLVAADYSDSYIINTTQKEITPETTVISLNNNKDELITNHNLMDYSLTTPTPSFTTSHSNETFDGLNNIQNNKTETTVEEEPVTVENNITEFVTTQLSSPSPFEFPKEHNELSLNETPALVKETTPLSVAAIDEVKTTTTTTNKPILHHIFAIEYDSGEKDGNITKTDLGQSINCDDGSSNASQPSKEEISKRLEKLVEINRIVVIHSKLEKHNTKSNSSDFILENIPTINKIGEISRWITVKLQNNNNKSYIGNPIDPNNATAQNRSKILNSKIIFDVETSTIPLEGLFEKHRIFFDNEVINYQITKPPLEINRENLELNEGIESTTANYYQDRVFQSVSNYNKSTEPAKQRHSFFKLHQTATYDSVVNSSHETDNVKLQANTERQILPKPESTTIGPVFSTNRPFLNFKKKITPPRVSPPVLRKKTLFSTSTAQPSTNLNYSLEKTTPKIFIRRRLYSRPGTAVTRPIIESTTVNTILDASPEPKRTRKPPSTVKSKFVRPLRKKNNSNSIPQGNTSTIIDDQFLSQTITTNKKQLATGINQLNNNSSYIDEEIRDILKAMSKTPLPVTINDNKSRETIKAKTRNRRPTTSRPATRREEISIKSTTEGRRKLFQKIQTKVDDEKNQPKIAPKLLPPNDYDYYDDNNESQLGHRDGAQVKVVLHETGAIECLDQGNFPHPLSCKKFISCAKIETGGVIGWEYTCPKGLNYDPVGGICNWATGLGCKD